MHDRILPSISTGLGKNAFFSKLGQLEKNFKEKVVHNR